jgi:hypothetical protein
LNEIPVIEFDVLKSHINSQVNSNKCSITIYNLFGQKILNYNFDISKGINDKSFSLNQLNTGLYIYHIIIGGSIQESNKFIIVK